MEDFEYKYIEENYDLIKNIISNQSCSSISMEFRNTVLNMAKKYGFITCSTCNSQLLRAVTIVYDKFNKEKEEKRKCGTKTTTKRVKRT